MQSLLEYDDTKMLTTSFLTIPVEQLLAISCDPCGNHIVDVFLSSKSVPLKKKTKLIKKFAVRIYKIHINFVLLMWYNELFIVF